MTRKQLSDFATSPLITPERLRENRSVVLSFQPTWANSTNLIAEDDPNLDTESDAVALSIRSAYRSGASTKVSQRDENGGLWLLTVPDFALCLEHTRFGNSLVANTNGKAEDANALFYLKMTFANAAEDNVTVARLVVGAGVHERVTQRKKGEDAPKWFTRNLHPDHLSREGAGKPEKDARSIAIAHSRRCAENAGIGADAVKAYVANLYALYAYHDDLYGIAWDFWPALAEA